MLNKYNTVLSLILILTTITCFSSNAEIIDEIQIEGNERIADETILMFSKTKLGDDIYENDLNDLLKNLYNTNFFKNVVVNINNKILKIIVEENPIIENITFNGIKSNTLKDEITKNLKLKARSSYNEILLIEDKAKITSSLKQSGYYFSNIEIELKDIGNNKVDLIFDINY